MYRRRIARDGVALSESELAEEDAAARAARLGKQEENFREEQRGIAEL